MVVLLSIQAPKAVPKAIPLSALAVRMALRESGPSCA